MKIEVYTQPLMIEIGGRLSLINVTITAGPDPMGLILCDLPLVWSFGADARAQVWAQLGTLMAPTDAAFL
jgi:hypothetical protein